MTSAQMSIAEHVNELRRRLIRTSIIIAVITIFSLSFGSKSFTVFIPLSFPVIPSSEIPNMVSGASSMPLTLYYPFPDPFNNMAVQLTVFLSDTLLPSGVKLIQTAPGQAFFSQIHVSFLIGIICSIPVIVREIFAFTFPALSKKTTRSIYKITFPILLLFMTGIVFSYILVIPFTLSFLYKYGESVGAETFVTISDFITFSLQFMIAFGLAFQLPMIMYGLSLAGLLNSNFWIKNFRYAVVIIAIFGALVTPDGSGVTMWFIVFPMTGLYALGILIIRRTERGAERLITTDNP
jgi:sec-independent protein translocase protein TatC